jgi:hypothetical protein
MEVGAMKNLLAPVSAASPSKEERMPEERKEGWYRVRWKHGEPWDETFYSPYYLAFLAKQGEGDPVEEVVYPEIDELAMLQRKAAALDWLEERNKIRAGVRIDFLDGLFTACTDYKHGEGVTMLEAIERLAEAMREGGQ